MINHPYVFFENFLSEEEIVTVNEYLEASNKRPDNLGTDFKNSEAFICELKEDFFLGYKLAITAHQCNNANFGYDLYDNVVSSVNLNYYSGKKNDYDWHQDSQSYKSKNDIKLTFLVNISMEEYEGGELHLFPNTDIVVEELNKPGNAIIFPSFTLHKVAPVTKGKRTSLACWFLGPGFK